MLQAYVDDSHDGVIDSGSYVLAGFAAPMGKWESLSHEWQRELDRSPPIKTFKMREMANSPRKLERAERFYRIIERHVDFAVSCRIDKGGLTRALQKVNWPPNIKNIHKLTNPFFSAFRFIIVGIAQEQERLLKVSEPIDFVFDDYKDKARVIAEYNRTKLSVTADVRRRMGSTPIFRDDNDVPPLQAADLFAWWVRKGTASGVPQKLYSWDVKADIPWLHGNFGEEQLFTEFYKTLDNPSSMELALLDDEQVDAWLAALKEIDAYS